MEQLKVLIKELVSEGVLENETTQLSRQIVDELKLRLSKTGGFVRAFHFKLAAPDSVEAADIHIHVRRGKATSEPLVSGEFRNDPENLETNRIDITIEVPRMWNEFESALRQFSMLIPELKDILRHEFEHSKQSGEEYDRISQTDFKDLKSVIKYFLDPAEVAAHVVGMYKAAKTRRVDLEDVFTERLRHVLRISKTAGGSEAEAQEIAQTVRDAWVAYAYQRFPSARVS